MRRSQLALQMLSLSAILTHAAACEDQMARAGADGLERHIARCNIVGGLWGRLRLEIRAARNGTSLVLLYIDDNGADGVLTRLRG